VRLESPANDIGTGGGGGGWHDTSMPIWVSVARRGRFG